MYNNVVAPYLKIGGHFIKTALGYEFVQDCDAVTYKPARVDVKQFRIYITDNPEGTNNIIPNQYSLRINKNNIFQHPFKTNAKQSCHNVNVYYVVHHIHNIFVRQQGYHQH